MIWSAWGPPSFPLSLTCVRERSAEKRYVLVCTLRCRVPCGHAALRRSTCGVFHLGTVFRVRTRELNPSLIQAAFDALHPDRVQPLKAALPSKSGREPKATRISCLRRQGRGRHTLLRQINASRWRPHVNKACPQYRALRTEKEKYELR